MTRGTRVKLIQTGVLFVLGGMMIAALIVPETSLLRTESPPLTVSVVIRENDSSLWGNTRLGMEQAANTLGVDLRFLTPADSNSSEEQHELMLREIERDSDAIIVAPADSAACGALIAGSKQFPPVISMESAVDRAYTGIYPENGTLGSALARTLAEDLPSGSVVLLLNTAPASSGVVRRLESASRTLQEAGMRVVVQPWDAASPEASLPDLINDRKAAAIIAFEPYATQKAAAAAETMASPPRIYGVGATNYIVAALERGTITAVAAWNEYAAGYLAVQQAVLAAGKSSPTGQALSFYLIRREDIYDPENQKLLFPVAN